MPPLRAWRQRTGSGSKPDLFRFPEHSMTLTLTPNPNPDPDCNRWQGTMPFETPAVLGHLEVTVPPS